MPFSLGNLANTVVRGRTAIGRGRIQGEDESRQMAADEEDRRRRVENDILSRELMQARTQKLLAPPVQRPTKTVDQIRDEARARAEGTRQGRGPARQAGVRPTATTPPGGNAQLMRSARGQVILQAASGIRSLVDEMERMENRELGGDPSVSHLPPGTAAATAAGHLLRLTKDDDVSAYGLNPRQQRYRVLARNLVLEIEKQSGRASQDFRNSIYRSIVPRVGETDEGVISTYRARRRQLADEAQNLIDGRPADLTFLGIPGLGVIRPSDTGSESAPSNTTSAAPATAAPRGSDRSREALNRALTRLRSGNARP